MDLILAPKSPLPFMNKLEILIVDDNIAAAQNQSNRIISYCNNLIQEEINITIALSFKDAIYQAERIKFDLIFTDFHLDNSNTGVDLIEYLRRQELIMHMTQCCYYTGKKLSSQLIKFIEFDYTMDKANTTKKEFVDTFIKMYQQYSSNFIKFGIDEVILVDKLVYIHRENKINKIFFFNEKGKLAQNSLDITFSEFSDKYLYLDFFAQISRDKIINFQYYKDYEIRYLNGSKNATHFAYTNVRLFENDEKNKVHSEHTISNLWREAYEAKLKKFTLKANLPKS